MATYTCDHCGLFIYQADNIFEPNIMWCRPCITEDFELINNFGLVYDTVEPQFFWVCEQSIRDISSIPKLKNKILFEYLPPEKVEKEALPCKRAYYGLEDCTCGRCPPRRRVKNTNPFGY